MTVVCVVNPDKRRKGKYVKLIEYSDFALSAPISYNPQVSVSEPATKLPKCSW